jgi:hypothetical protein
MVVMTLHFTVAIRHVPCGGAKVAWDPLGDQYACERCGVRLVVPYDTLPPGFVEIHGASQLESLVAFLRALPTPEELRLATSIVRDALAAAQNQPPEGAADGTVDAALWIAVRDVANTLSHLANAIETAVKVGGASCRK